MLTFKSILIAAVATGTLAVTTLGTSVASYAKALVHETREWIEGEIPIGIGIARAKELAQQIDPAIDRCKVDVARGEVSVENLEHEVSELQKRSAEGRLALERASEVARTASRTPVGARITVELQQRFDALERDEALLAAKLALLERQRKAVDAATKKLGAVRAERERILEQIAYLEIQQTILEATAAESPSFVLDDSALGEAKRVVADVQNRLAVWEKLLAQDAAPSFEEGEPVELTVLVAEIGEHLARR